MCACVCMSSLKSPIPTYTFHNLPREQIIQTIVQKVHLKANLRGGDATIIYTLELGLPCN